MRDISDNEVGAFAIADSDDLLFVTDIVLVKQKVTCVSVCFEDESVANYFEDQVDAGRKPEQFARIWCHSHPGTSPQPSSRDENTFERVFGSCDWAVMFIIATDGKSYARLRFNTGPGSEIQIPVCVDYGVEFKEADFNSWKKEYHQNVIEESAIKVSCGPKEVEQVFGSESIITGQDIIDEIDQMDPAEREMLMEELAVRSDFWQESEGYYE